jgi:hypothetical protein
MNKLFVKKENILDTSYYKPVEEAKGIISSLGSYLGSYFWAPERE